MPQGQAAVARAMRAFVAALNCTGDVLKPDWPRPPTRAPWLYETTFKYNCSQLFEKKYGSPIWPPPEWDFLGSSMQAAFTLNGIIPVVENHLSSRADGASVNKWYASEIVVSIDRVKKGECPTSYGDSTEICKGLDKYRSTVDGQRGLVLGSQSPWAESILLALNAEHVTTLEYQKTECVGSSDSPCNRLKVVHPSAAAKDFKKSGGLHRYVDLAFGQTTRSP